MQEGGHGENLLVMENKPVCLSAANSGCPASCESRVCADLENQHLRRRIEFRLGVGDSTTLRGLHLSSSGPSRFSRCEPRSGLITSATINDRKVEDSWKVTDTGAHTRTQTHPPVSGTISEWTSKQDAVE